VTNRQRRTEHVERIKTRPELGPSVPSFMKIHSKSQNLKINLLLHIKNGYVTGSRSRSVRLSPAGESESESESKVRRSPIVDYNKLSLSLSLSLSLKLRTVTSAYAEYQK
jgi:hypothetical protein